MSMKGCGGPVQGSTWLSEGLRVRVAVLGRCMPGCRFTGLVLRVGASEANPVLGAWGFARGCLLKVVLVLPAAPFLYAAAGRTRLAGVGLFRALVQALAPGPGLGIGLVPFCVVWEVMLSGQ